MNGCLLPQHQLYTDDIRKDTMNSALLVIDIQKSFKARPFWSELDVATGSRHSKQLIRWLRGARHSGGAGISPDYR